MRHAHYLKRIQGNESPQHLVFFDTETDEVKISEKEVKHVLKFGYACYCKRDRFGNWTQPEYIRFTRLEDFWGFVFGKAQDKTKMYVFCHNTGFDLQVVNTFHYLEKSGYKLLGAVIEAPPTILRFRREKHTLLILDTLNFWRVPLKQLGDDVGLPKMEYEKARLNETDFEQYAKRDVEIIHKAVTEWLDFIRDNNLGGFAPTVASQALRTFKHRFMSHNIGIHNDEKICRLERASFHGGRTEAFRIGEIGGPWYLVDFNSQYPAMMKYRTYPSKLLGRVRNLSISNLERLVKEYKVVCRVVLETVKPIYCNIANNKLTFPIGQFVTTLTTPEVIRALKDQAIVEIQELVCYESAPIFEKFIDYFYGQRLIAKQSNDNLHAEFFKKIMNSLFGKFGQHGYVFKEVGHDPNMPNGYITDYDVVTGITTKRRVLNGLIQEFKQEGESRDSFPAIAAHVTAEGRLLLWESIERAGIENVAYSDTDSLLVNNDGLANLHAYLDKSALGMLKVEKVYSNCVIHGLKDYQLDEVVKLKGIRKNATKISENEYIQESWSSIKSALRNNHLDAPHIKLIKKSLSRGYDKGIIQPDGSVKPFKLTLGGVA